MRIDKKSIDGSQLARKEIPEVPHVAIREALLNSFFHRNYPGAENCFDTYVLRIAANKA